MEAEAEQLLKTVGKDAELAWEAIKPYAESHFSQFLIEVFDHVMNVVKEQEAKEHNPVRKLELKATMEVLSGFKGRVDEFIITKAK